MASPGQFGEIIGRGLAEALVNTIISVFSELGQDLVDSVKRLDFKLMPGTFLPDKITGTDGNDLFYTGGGADTVRGGAGSDVIFAEKGDDVIDGGTGSDFMSGGSGKDRFVFALASLQGGDRDILIDAAAGDRIDFDSAAETALRIGGTSLTALTGDTAMPTALVAGMTNIAIINGNIVIDLNNDGRFDADLDQEIVIPVGITLQYDAGRDWFQISAG